MYPNPAFGGQNQGKWPMIRHQSNSTCRGATCGFPDSTCRGTALYNTWRGATRNTPATQQGSRCCKHSSELAGDYVVRRAGQLHLCLMQ